MKKYGLKICFILVVLLNVQLYAIDGWHITSYLGWSEALDSTLKVNRQNDGTDSVIRADWEGNSFKDSLYYAERFEKWKGDSSWGIEWIHHKIYLKNTTTEVETFSISDGYNLLFLTKAFKHENYISRFGAGVVIGHPDMTLNGRERWYMEGGWGGSYLSGVGVEAGVEKWVYESKRYFTSLESKLTLSWSRIRISDNKSEYADSGLNVALHMLVGFGSKPVENATIKDKIMYFLVPAAVQIAAQKYPTPGIE